MNVAALADKRFAVLLGGTAAERDISLESGQNVAAALESVGAHVTCIDSADPRWWQQLQDVQFAFNVLHGPGGEDGTVQGLLESLNVPYSGSGILGSSLTMDKIRTKWLWQGTGLPTPAFALLTDDADWQGLIDDFGVVFVKPATEGSSIGMSKVTHADGLRAAYEDARRFGDQVLAEAFVAGSEYTVAILGDRALAPIEIRPAADFYDFNAKYVSEQTQFLCPAELSDADARELSQLALRAFLATGASVWGRVDVMRSHSGQWQLLEVNTVPGMTSHSLVPMAAQAAGLPLPALLAEIYRLSLKERDRDQ